MEVKIKKYHLKLSEREFLAFILGLREYLLNTINDHWINFSQPDFVQGQNFELNLLEFAARSIGREDIYELFMYDVEQIFDSKNKKAKKTNKKK